MSTIKTKKVQVGTDSTASNNFTIYTPGTPDGTVRIGNGNADSVTDAITLDSSGNITAAQNLTVSGDLSVTGSVPANTGPAFSAYMSTNQSVSAATFTKVAFDAEQFDTNSNYDNTTNYRFTPSVEGYYQVNIVLYVDIGARGIIRLYKNGVYAHAIHDVDTNDTRVISGSVLTYMNGTTDYLEVYGWRTTAGDINGGLPEENQFSAFLARAA